MSAVACAGSVGSVGTFSGTGRAQTSTAEPGGEAQIYKRAIIPRVGQPFRGEYVGQFVLFTDPTPDDGVTPTIVDECGFANWSSEQTRGYEGLLLDRSTSEGTGVEISMYLNQNEERVDVGEAFLINNTVSCSDDFLGLELEAVPIERFDPGYDTGENPLVGEEPGPTVSPDEEGQTEGPGQSGFGVGAAVVGIGGVAILGRISDRL